MKRAGIGPWRALGVALALAACGGEDPNRNLDSLDAELADGNSTGNQRDPALTSALRDQIMVDPQLAAQSNPDAVRPPSRPYSAPMPADQPNRAAAAEARTSEKLKTAPPAAQGCSQCAARRDAMTLGGLAARQRGRTSACAANIGYSTRWATLLPADVPLYPDARVTEAAGNSRDGCQLRVVSFATSASVQTVLDWYYTRVSNAGYSAEHQADGSQHVLAGTKGEGAYAIFVAKREDGGADVDMVVNNGR
ncbi:hypothetical protein [Sphingomonas sp.]|uniref:hypothetical protein n=1 Tax=Sphingomonas sp. TaxID=28214 RepID=UPI001E10D4CA|nr:hypothetical protein [Sphingomonas sp.]MBX9797015.1 hypothetical protein [Sphingomonas sp.]